MEERRTRKPGTISLEDFPRGAKMHLVGAGGAGMSALSVVLLQMGYHVEGSDLKESSYVRRQLPLAPHVRRFLEVGTLDVIAHLQEHDGEGAHSCASRADQVHLRPAGKILQAYGSGFSGASFFHLLS